MPIKFKPSQVVKDRQTGKVRTEHYYIKNVSKEELIETLNSRNAQPKLKQKVRNELTRRKVNIVYVNEAEA